MVMQQAFRSIARDRSLGWEAGSLLLFIIGEMGFENWVRIPQQEIADYLGMRQPNVSRALNALVDRGILVRGDRAAGAHTYRINSHLAWRGKVKNLQAHRATVQEPKLRLVHDAGGASG